MVWLSLETPPKIPRGVLPVRWFQTSQIKNEDGLPYVTLVTGVHRFKS